MANKKVTKKEYFGMVRAIVEGADIGNKEEILKFVDHEVELLEKKASKSGQTATQKANEGIKAKIMEILKVATEPMTITEIQAQDEGLAKLSNQKVSALLTQLKDTKDIERVMDKKKAKFKIAE